LALDDFKSGGVLLEAFQKRINCSSETYLMFKKPARSALGGFQKLSFCSGMSFYIGAKDLKLQAVKSFGQLKKLLALKG
jgi:hypothetical protein